MQFVVKKIKSNDIKKELLSIGFDESYIDNASLKHEFLNLKIQNLEPHQATIIKQTALSKGCDAGVHRGVLLSEIKQSDIILSGSKKQLEETAKSLLNQPFKLKDIGNEILAQLENKNAKPKIMGILNITDNSFSDGTLDKKEAINKAAQLIKDGADIIDIGAEATNWNAKTITPEIELMRLEGIIKEIKKLNVIVSVDTRNAITAEKMLLEGADIINDISGLNYDNKMLDAIKNSNAEIVITHSKGTPDTMDKMCQYKNLSDEIYNDLYEKIEKLNNSGVSRKRIIIDTGFGFAKNNEQNFELLKKINEFNSLKVRHLAGVSRKRFLKSLITSDDNEMLDEITMLASFYLIQNNVDILRVHNVKKTKLALDFFNSIY